MTRPKPIAKSTATGYPDRRSFLKAIGVGALAVSLWPAVSAGDKATEADETASEADKKDDSDTRLKKKIALLAEALGSDDFKQRRNATRELIQLGRGRGKDEAADARVRKLVLAQMEKYKARKDPEVAQRARNIIIALTPKPSPPPSPPMVKGKIRVRGW
mgnify:CR=1 FL=1